MVQKLLHVVLISFKPDTPIEKQQEIFDRYQTLAEDCGGQEAGILFWQVGKNLDLRKNVHLVEVAVFSGDSSFQQFRNHPVHRDIAAALSAIADWQVGDIPSQIQT